MAKAFQPNPKILKRIAQAANYYSQDGDSGAPVFSTPDFNNNVYLYGIHVGIYCFGGSGSSCSGGSFEPIYSPWEGIKSDLGLQ